MGVEALITAAEAETSPLPTKSETSTTAPPGGPTPHGPGARSP